MKTLSLTLLASVMIAEGDPIPITNTPPMIVNASFARRYINTDVPTYFNFDIVNLITNHSYMLQEAQAVITGWPSIPCSPCGPIFSVDLTRWHDIWLGVLWNPTTQRTNAHYGPTCQTNWFMNIQPYQTNECWCPPQYCNQIHAGCFSNVTAWATNYITNIVCSGSPNPVSVFTNGWAYINGGWIYTNNAPYWAPQRVWRVVDLTATNITAQVAHN